MVNFFIELLEMFTDYVILSVYFGCVVVICLLLQGIM